MTNNSQISGAIENEGATNNNAQEQSERAYILASGSDIFSPVTDNSSLVWHPSNEWVHDCVQDLSGSQAEADGEWDVIYKIAIGDCIKFCRCYHGSLPNTTFNNIYHGKTCPLTFPSSEVRGVPGNFSLSIIDEVHEIQRHYPNFTIPEPETLVMHLRLGDILEGSSSNVSELLISGGDPGYPTKKFRNTIKSIHELLDNIHSSKAKTVHIVGGSHRKEFWRKSRVYAGCLHRAIETAGYNITMRLEGTHPDIDFYYISHATQMVVSAGGYSNLMGQLVEYRGGKIIGRSFGVSW